MPTVSHLFFDMNSYFASVAQAEEPALLGKPVAVLTTDAPNAAVIAASLEAKRCGVGMGTRQAEARQLCPQIVFRAVKHDVCTRYHHRIRAAVEEVLPISKAHSVDEFSCLLTGSQQDLETALAVGRQLQLRLLRLNPALRCSVGLGPNRLLAKIAAELEKPLGLNWLLPEVLPGRIAHLALDDLPGISRAMRSRLERAGVMDVPMLYALAPKRARAIWGSVEGERFLTALQGGEVSETAAQHHSLGHGQVLTGSSRIPDQARLVARRLTVKAGSRLRREGYWARGLWLGVVCADKGRLSWGGQIMATQDTFFLLQTLDRYWNRLSPRRPLRVHVYLTDLVAESAHIPDLFPSQATTLHLQVLRAVDALNRRFGKDTIHLGPLAQHQVPYAGAKIAFGRIPDLDEFTE